MIISREELKDSLSNSVLNIDFIKKDGTERKMKCTLRSDLLPKKLEEFTSTNKRKESLNSIAVFDLEIQDWRSIIIENIVSVNSEES